MLCSRKFWFGVLWNRLDLHLFELARNQNFLTWVIVRSAGARGNRGLARASQKHKEEEGETAKIFRNF